MGKVTKVDEEKFAQSLLIHRFTLQAASVKHFFFLWRMQQVRNLPGLSGLLDKSTTTNLQFCPCSLLYEKFQK